MKRQLSFFAVLGITVVLVLAGCGGTNASTTTSSSIHATAITTSTAKVLSSPSGGPTSLTVNLKHEPTGTTDLNWDPSTKALTVKIALTGLAPNSTHPAFIHSGSCSNPGSVLYNLENVVADDKGVGSSISSIANVTNGIPAKDWSLDVHNGPRMDATDQALTIVCADITNPNSATDSISSGHHILRRVTGSKPLQGEQSVRVVLNSAPSTSVGQNATGTAKLSLTGTTLTVVINMTGLEPNSSHDNHIHTGSCASQGDMLYELKVLTADASGNASATTTIQNVSSIPSSGWYINVHHTTDVSNPTAFDPIACGDITPGGN